MIDVDEVEARGVLPQPHLARAGLADLDLFPVQDFRPAGFMDSDRVRHRAGFNARSRAKEKPRRGSAGRGLSCDQAALSARRPPAPRAAAGRRCW